MTREPIHLGSGEPVLLLHPFLMSQAVWQTVAQQLATPTATRCSPHHGRHNGGLARAPGS
ncbi:alpha/beta hydrolase domain protein [Mycobacterium xenopi 3993]|nr:alpha/beta hydrolase domain protein [Mycobacterium xenopi 3993]